MAILSAFPPGFGNFSLAGPDRSYLFQDKARSERPRDGFAIPTKLDKRIFSDMVEGWSAIHPLQPDRVAIDPGESAPPPKNLVIATHILSGDLITEIFIERNDFAHAWTIRTGDYARIGADPIRNRLVTVGGVRRGGGRVAWRRGPNGATAQEDGDGEKQGVRP